MATNFMGKDGFIWWQGVVEDRHDPLFLGRCRVRILGWHTEDKTEMPTESIPWAFPIQPITSAAQTGVGISPTGPVEGTWVVGFFRDGEAAQEPVFFGTLGGIPEDQAPDPSKQIGFSDPRIEKPDEEHPFVLSNKRLLSYDVDADARVPRAPKLVSHFSGADIIDVTKESTKNETTKIMSGIVGDNPQIQVVVEEYGSRSAYPDINFMYEPTTPRSARGIYGNFNEVSGPLSKYGLINQKKKWRQALGAGFGVAENTKDKWNEPDPEAMYGARYPYNHVQQTESGHLIEMDDTPNKERLHWYHRSGTFTEIGSLGHRITKVVSEDFKINLMNDYHRVVGSKYENIAGKLDVVSQKYFHKVKSGVFKVEAQGDIIFDNPTADFTVNSKGITLDASGGAIVIKGRSISIEKATAASTENTKGSETKKVGGKYSLRSGSMALSSRGSSGITAGGAINFTATDNIQESVMNLVGGLMGAPARSFKAAMGDILFETVLLGGVDINVGLAGLLGSISIDKLGQITLTAAGGLSTLTMGLTGIELSYLGLSTIKLGPTGVEIAGLTAKMEGTTSAEVSGLSTAIKGSVSCDISGLSVGIKGDVSAKMEAVLANVEASGIATVKGSATMLG